MQKPQRKQTRLQTYDYSQAAAYFVTICTKNHENLLWSNVGATIGRPHKMPLSKYGKIVDQAVQSIPIHYSTISVDNYVIMPNHIHLLLQIQNDQSGRPMVAPTVSTVIQQTKGVITKQIGFPIWQKSFYDHVIRNENDYAEIWEYIDNNPLKWQEDDFYSTQ